MGERAVVYTSKRKGMRLWLIKPNEFVHPQISQTVATNAGLYVDFVEGVYSTSNEKIMELLDKHPECGITFKRSGEIIPGKVNVDDVIKNSAENDPNMIVRVDDVKLPPSVAPVAESTPQDVIAALEAEIKKLKAEQGITEEAVAARALADTVGYKPKKSFTCPICKEGGFKSGFEVGRHKKEMHPEGK